MKTLKNDFCCKAMYESITEDKIIEYEMTDLTYDMPVTKNSVRRLSFCPWCGKKLPRGLIKEFFEILENEYGMEDTEIVKDDFANVPEEFKTDEWWKKRGL